jgi:hypothetical protein
MDSPRLLIRIEPLVFRGHYDKPLLARHLQPAHLLNKSMRSSPLRECNYQRDKCLSQPCSENLAGTYSYQVCIYSPVLDLMPENYLPGEKDRNGIRSHTVCYYIPGAKEYGA